MGKTTGPKPAKVNWLISLPWEERDEYVDFAQKRGLGLEISAFCSGPALNDRSVQRERIRAFKRLLSGWPNPLAFHGAFIDIMPHSGDHAIAAASRQRILQSLTAATEIGCHKIVFHTGFNPLIPVAQ
jgi:sugar phosphate isomerase/epimerase